MDKADASLEELLVGLNSTRARVREQAALALGELGDKRAVEPLINTLQGDENFMARVNAATALGKLGDKRAIPPLIAAFKDGPVWPNAVEALTRFRDASLLPDLINSMDTPNKDMSHGRVMEEVIRCILSFGETAFQQLLTALKFQPALREPVAQALGMTKDPRAVEALIPFLADSEISPTVAQALTRIGDSRAIQPLLTFLEQGTEIDHWRAATQALARFQTPQVVQALQKIATDSTNQARKRSFALEALGQSGEIEAIPTLVQQLSDKERIVQLGAAAGLAYTGETDLLVNLLQTSNNVQEQAGAVEALGMLGSFTLHTPQLMATRAPVEPLIAALVHGALAVQEKAMAAIAHIVLTTSILTMSPHLVSGMPAEMLNRFNEQKADFKLTAEKLVAPVIQVLQNDGSGLLRASAAMTLGSLPLTNQERVVKPLIVALSDASEDVRFRVAEALVKLEATDEEIRPALSKLSQENNVTLRNFAAYLLELLNKRPSS